MAKVATPTPLPAIEDLELAHAANLIEVLPPTGGKVGRPFMDVDADVVERAASIGCTYEEIAALNGVCRMTFYNHMMNDPELKEAYERGKAKGRISLRRLQWQGVQDRNPTMLIWLGKQLLDQRDTSSLQHLDKFGNPADAPVPVVNLTISRE